MENATPSPHPLRDGDESSPLTNNPLDTNTEIESLRSSPTLTPSAIASPSPISAATPNNYDNNNNDNDNDINNRASPLNRPSAHTILRLIQCARCSRPLRNPLRLPCGNTLCRECLPPLHRRRGITYPDLEERKQGFTCSSCLAEHCLGDCGVDVLLTGLGEVVEQVLSLPSSPASTPVSGSGATVSWKDYAHGHGEVKSAYLQGSGVLEGLYALMKEGGFGYDATEVEYTAPPTTLSNSDASLRQLRERLRSELDCHVCYSLILDPLTTCCGHTFCHGCVSMVLGHSDLCPVCRRKLNMSTTVQSEPTNKRIAALMETLFAEELVARRESSALEGTNPNETTLPLFVSSLSLPTMPTFLHIFEPRYRLMIRRVMQSRGRKFGMVMYNRAGRSQGELGRSQFMQYGTVLVVDRYELLPDGRSLVVATGTSRFKVLSCQIVDGYHVGRVQRVDDISITEEETREALETAASVDSSSPSAETSTDKPLGSMSTQDLFQLSLAFVRRQHGQGVAWLRPRALLAYGDAPTDPALFPWWFASILPVWEEERYSLLSATSVRERLKVTARWVQKLESPVPLLVFGIVSLIFGDAPSMPLGSNVFTTFTPFSMSVSVSFGGSNRAFTTGTRQAHFPHEDSPTNIPQIAIVTIFLAIFVAQVATNAMHIWRTRQRERIEEQQRAATERPGPGPGGPAPAGPPDEAEGAN